MHVRNAYLVVVGHGFLDVFDRDLAVLHGEEITQCFLRDRKRDLLAVETRIRDDAFQCAFEFAHVRADVLGDEKRDLLVKREPRRCGLGEENRDPHFQFWWFERDGEAPAEAGNEAFFDAGDFLRVGIAGDDDLFVRFDQRIEEIEKLFLRAVLAAEELDVVDQQEVE